jgi:hypothetical protein
MYFLFIPCSGKIALTVVNEDKVYETIYTNETVYSLIGPEGCIAVDISLGQGRHRGCSGKCVFRYGIAESIGPNFE